MDDEELVEVLTAVPRRPDLEQPPSSNSGFDGASVRTNSPADRSSANSPAIRFAMKWFTCIGEDGLERYANHLRVAIASAKDVGQIAPNLIFDGDESTVRAALPGLDFVVHQRSSRLLPDILKHPDIPGFRHRIARGAFLRYEISDIEMHEPYVLYTDCDVMFTNRVALKHLKPDYIAAAPEDKIDDWSYFNSGVLIINTSAARSDLADLTNVTKLSLGDAASIYDQGPLNNFYRERWDRLPIEANWKPYWGWNENAMVVHFHGPKLPALEVLIEGRGSAVVHDIWRELYNRNCDAYLKYYAMAKTYLV